jgi:hypothetical protein
MVVFGAIVKKPQLALLPPRGFADDSIELAKQ